MEEEGGRFATVEEYKKALCVPKKISTCAQRGNPKVNLLDFRK